MSESRDCGLTVFGKVFEAFNRFEAKATNDRQSGIAQSREYLWSMSRVGPRLIFPAREVANVVETVLNPPMRARQRQEVIGASLLCGQTCNGVDGLGAFLAANDPLTGNAAHLRETRPGRGQKRGQRCGRLQTPGFNSAMTFLNCLSASKIRRRRPYR
jgi:hypothetical protein